MFAAPIRATTTGEKTIRENFMGHICHFLPPECQSQKITQPIISLPMSFPFAALVRIEKFNMKKIFCFLILIALSTGVRADDNKKKKKPATNNAHAQGPGGGGTNASGISRGLGQMGSHNNAPHGNTHNGMPGNNPMTHSKSGGHASDSASKSTGQPGGNAHSSNPLMRRGGQANSTT